MRHLEDVGKQHWLGTPEHCGGWRRFTLYHIERNREGGSTSWPIAEIDVVDHPSKDRVNPHKEIKISIRNDVRRRRSGIEVDGNKSKLRHVDDIVDAAVLDETVAVLIGMGVVSRPFCVYTCMRHIEDFRVEGDFFEDDQDPADE